MQSYFNCAGVQRELGGNMFQSLMDLTDKNADEKIRVIENYLRANEEELKYILTHLDSSNIIEINTSKTRIYEGGENELQ